MAIEKYAVECDCSEHTKEAEEEEGTDKEAGSDEICPHCGRPSHGKED